MLPGFSFPPAFGPPTFNRAPIQHSTTHTQSSLDQQTTFNYALYLGGAFIIYNVFFKR